MPKFSHARERVRLRASIAGGTALAQLPLTQACDPAPDPAYAISERADALRARQLSLISTWQDLEAWLIKHRNWHQLSEPEQALVPEARDLRPIHDELTEIDHGLDRLLLQLTGTSATSRNGVLAKLHALLELPSVGNDPDARGLLESCQADMEQLWQAKSER